jgi:hypothetical protein
VRFLAKIHFFNERAASLTVPSWSLSEMSFVSLRFLKGDKKWGQVRWLFEICRIIKKRFTFLSGQVRMLVSKIVKFEISEQTLVSNLVMPLASINN